MKKLAELWTSGELAAKFPDHVKVKKTAAGDAWRFEYLNKVRMPDGRTFGDLLVSEVTLDDCDHIMANLPKTTETPAARRQWAQTLRRALALAVYPVKACKTLPIPKGWLPSVPNGKAKAWIYPIRGPRAHAMHARRSPSPVASSSASSPARACVRAKPSRSRGPTSTSSAVRCASTRTRRTIHVLGRSGEDVARALATWKTIRGAKAKKIPAVFPEGAPRRSRRLRAPSTRGPQARRREASTTHASVPKPDRLLLRAHDLRGSFVTLALACGKTEAWVTDRTGHKSSAMIYQVQEGLEDGRGARARMVRGPRRGHPGAPPRCKRGASEGARRRETPRRNAKPPRNSHFATGDARNCAF